MDSTILDRLLVDYLDLLDQYQVQRKALSGLFSSGHFSLAEANFKSPSKIRHGRDYYDERMQALRKIRIEEAKSSGHANRPCIQFSTTGQAVRAEKKIKNGLKNGHETRDTPEDKPAEPPEQSKDESETEPPSLSSLSLQDKSNDTDPAKLIIDPLHWYGILVPPALRSAQVDFVKAVEEPIPAIVNIATQMRELEIEIGRARKRLRKAEAAGPQQKPGNGEATNVTESVGIAEKADQELVGEEGKSLWQKSSKEQVGSG
ncbi:hypothetical protein P152DRAFT_490173 [Eremomyces bilateralis CBS 781.70]|uniref:Vacuolar ATPase assembly protein VMA22 n=1 Tax=Eremomyces bilateralis CBS 781.70 TaxID=1392243 RepID=A0A6G1FZ66_9PEZI|nr:uncharacterized protein P152DRAFT_490173 [Eremomyces bilateralis CBS 781.70]KAF1811084.1 hypothetical protein P152DRAFT_490173 [Eremomyces bilateralis CBS 781.70]